MNELRSYFLSIIVVVVITAIARRLMGEKGTPAAVGKLMTGLILTMAILSPLLNLDFAGMNDFFDAYAFDAKQAVAAGTEISKQALSQSIKEKSEAYILDKARHFGAQLTVQVHLSDETIPKPNAVHISGNISPYAKSSLQNMIQSDFGIDKEHQTWT